MTDFIATWPATLAGDVPCRVGLAVGGAVRLVEESMPTVPDYSKIVTVTAPDGAVHVLNAVNATRGTGALVLYTTAEAYAGVNRWGMDVLLDPATATAKALSDRWASSTAVAFRFQPGDVVLSGHGLSAEWLRAHVDVGDVLTFGTKVIEPPPAAGSRTANCSVWAMMWPNSPKVDFANLPMDVDEVRLGFLVNDGRLVGDGPLGLADTRSGLKAFLAAREGRIVTPAVGGGGYTITIPSVEKYVENLLAAEARLGVSFGGLNWDWESSDFKAAGTKTISVSRALKALRGKGFYVSWSPNGTFKDDYRSVLKGAPDVVDEIAQQFYDSVISYQSALTETQKYVTLFGADKVGIACALTDSSGTGAAWPLNTCLEYLARFREDAGVRKTCFWEAGNSSTVAWARGAKAAMA